MLAIKGLLQRLTLHNKVRCYKQTLRPQDSFITWTTDYPNTLDKTPSVNFGLRPTAQKHVIT